MLQEVWAQGVSAQGVSQALQEASAVQVVWGQVVQVVWVKCR